MKHDMHPGNKKNRPKKVIGEATVTRYFPALFWKMEPNC